MDMLGQYLDISVFTVLGLMSMLAMAYAVERLISYKRINVVDYEQLEQLKLELNKGLPVIATVASNAPYVGLLGTVFGIMLTFYDIGQSGQIDTHAVMVGLSLALKATALGLLVAIPSMIFYNLLVARAERLISEWKIDHHLVDTSL
ncbi:MAG: TonB-system energizer ExbB [Granulosicoccus sp.]